ncbi:MAG: hypothetical protein WCI48_03090 [Bacteroidota bacterium]|jgi:hypothetical protein
MTQPDENINSWLDDLSQLIRKKKEENEILKKLQESLQHTEDNRNNETAPLSAENKNIEETNNQ